MRPFQAPLDTCLGSPFFASLSVHGLHFTVYEAFPRIFANFAVQSRGNFGLAFLFALRCSSKASPKTIPKTSPQTSPKLRPEPPTSKNANFAQNFILQKPFAKVRWQLTQPWITQSGVEKCLAADPNHRHQNKGSSRKTPFPKDPFFQTRNQPTLIDSLRTTSKCREESSKAIRAKLTKCSTMLPRTWCSCWWTSPSSMRNTQRCTSYSQSQRAEDALWLWARAMTTQFLDNKFALSKFIDMAFIHLKKQQRFWTIFLSAPHAPLLTKCHFYFYLSSCRLWMVRASWPARQQLTAKTAPLIGKLRPQTLHFLSTRQQKTTKNCKIHQQFPARKRSACQ